MPGLTKNTIAFLCHPYHRGGVTKWMADAAKECALQGYEVYFITLNPLQKFISGDNRPAMIDMVRGDISNLKVCSIPVRFYFEFSTRSHQAWVYAKALLKFLPQGVPVVVSDDPSVWQAASMVSTRNPMIGVLHSDDQAYFDLANKHHEQVCLFISVSKRIVAKCREYSNLTSLPIPVIPCGIVLPPFKEYQVTRKETPSLIWIGRVEEKQKRVSDLIKVALELKRLDIPFTLDIIGEGPEYPWVKDQIIKNNLAEEVRTLGWLNASTIFEKLNGAHTLILTSNYEGMPVSVMEALSCGCSVVSSRVSGIEDYEDDPLAKNCLWIYPAGEIPIAVEYIRQSMSNTSEKRRQMAHELAVKEFSIQGCVQKYFHAIHTHLHPFEPYPIKKISISPVAYFRSLLLSLMKYLKVKFVRR